MPNIIEEIVGGLVGGLTVGVIGWATDFGIGTVFEAFGKIMPIFIPLGLIYAMISFLIGISEAYFAGISFCIGIIFAGFMVNDPTTAFAGVISMLGIALSHSRKQIEDMLGF
jgi:hypothetical protein